MKWTYGIENKLVASLSLLSLCLLVLFSHYIDRNHTAKVKASISTLYEDRLIAEDYILKMTIALYQIKEHIADKSYTNAANSSIDSLLLNIQTINEAYLLTKFTELEKIKAGELQIALHKIEPNALQSNPSRLAEVDHALAILNELSSIQLLESKQIMNQAEQLYLSGKISSQLVFTIILIILIILQALVFTSKSLIPKIKSNFPNLN